MMTGRPGYAPSEEHELLRRTVRELADAKIAPAAADVDAGSRFPQEALDALTGASLHAAHIPERFGTVPLLLSGSEELKRRYLVPVARGEALFSYALSEAGAGSDAASMKTRAARDGDQWVLKNNQDVDHQRRGLAVLHGDGGD
jgi:alkylation response protein AidB-like acyl-CoA dehydrogenase